MFSNVGLRLGKHPLADCQIHLTQLLLDQLLQHTETGGLPSSIIHRSLQCTPEILDWPQLRTVGRVCSPWDKGNVWPLQHLSSLGSIAAAGKVRPGEEVPRRVVELNEQLPGYTNQDCLTTANFLHLMDKTSDILNSISPNRVVFRVALCQGKSKDIAESIFEQVEEMLQVLTDVHGMLLIHTKRRTGFLGLLADIKTVRRLLEDMDDDLLHLFPYKFSQDHLELFFNGRNGLPTRQVSHSTLRFAPCQFLLVVALQEVFQPTSMHQMTLLS